MLKGKIKKKASMSQTENYHPQPPPSFFFKELTENQVEIDALFHVRHPITYDIK